MTKNDIRKKYAEKRKLLSDDHTLAMTGRIMEHFNEMNLGIVKAALSYSPIADRNEFNVGLCETLLQVRHQGIEIAHPRIIRESNFMEAVVIRHLTRFRDNHYSIKEPSHGKILTPEAFDLVLVPLLAFDSKGFRVGYGGGFYDRWLAQCRPGINKIGFSFFGPLKAIDDINEFDVPLNYCITPMRVYEF